VRRFGYLQLDTVSIAGARSHAIVLMSRLAGATPALAESLLQPGAPLFEYWGHEASWLPLELYPALAFRRREFKAHPWWGDLIAKHPSEARKLRKRVRDEGPLRSLEMEGRGSRGWWDLKLQKRIATALWSCGEFAIRERTNFQRTYDLAERVIPEDARGERLAKARGFEQLLERALAGHGFASTGTLARTWRLTNCRREIETALQRLVARAEIVPARLVAGERAELGWLRACDVADVERVRRLRPRAERGVLLSPFDPVLWERPRVARLFDFDQKLEIYKPAAQRTYGYYCMPVLAGERLIGRVDLKAHTAAGGLEVLSCRYESTGSKRPGSAREERATQTALARYADALELEVDWRSRRAVPIRR